MARPGKVVERKKWLRNFSRIKEKMLTKQVSLPRDTLLALQRESNRRTKEEKRFVPQGVLIREAISEYLKRIKQDKKPR